MKIRYRTENRDGHMKYYTRWGRLPFFYLLVSLMLTTQVRGQKVQLVWSVIKDTTVSHYRVFRSIHMDSTFTMIGTVNHPDSIYYDEDIQSNTTYYYAVVSVNKYDDVSRFSDVVDISTGSLPVERNTYTAHYEFQLYQNYPNPFNPTTTIFYSLPQTSHVELKIYNVNGQEVYKLVDEFQEAGQYNVDWQAVNYEGTKVTSGIYFYKMVTLHGSKFRRMMVLK